jgi:hypothetical protein
VFSAPGNRLASPFLLMYNPNYLDREGLAMSEREDQTERLPLWASKCGGQQRGRIMKSPREVLIRPIALSLAAMDSSCCWR